MKLIPSKKQWKHWKLPSKHGALGLLVGIICIIITVLVVFLQHAGRRHDRAESRVFQDSMMYRLERLEEMLHRSLQDDETRRALLDSARNEAACIDEAGLAETALDSAIVAIGLRDYDRGLMLLRKARASAHGDSARVSDTYVYEGVALGLSGNHEEALIALDSSVSYRHESPDAWARCLIEKGNRGIIYVASH